MGLLTLSKLQEIYKSANIFYFCNVFMVGSLLCFWQGICILKIFFNSSFFMVQLIFAPLPLWWRISLKLYRKVKTLWLWSFGSWSTSVSLILDIKWDLPWGRQWRRPASKDAFPALVNECWEWAGGEEGASGLCCTNLCHKGPLDSRLIPAAGVPVSTGLRIAAVRKVWLPL